MVLVASPPLSIRFLRYSLCYANAVAFQPMPLSRRPLPFDHPEWVFELKYDGFRSLAIIDNGRCQLVSRNGHPFNSFTDLRQAISAPSSRTGKTVLDGEIVCLDKFGKPQFRDLRFHRAEPCFYAFDLLMRDGKDLRREGLIDRKHELRRLLIGLPVTSPLRYADYLEHHGTALFQRVCEMDLEGIVAKHSFGPYVTDRERSTWFKIRNRSYSQMQGREELFERERHKEPAPGWHCCELACAELEQANVSLSGGIRTE
jgi:bifunctional non-homologous end joining protein LigD